MTLHIVNQSPWQHSALRQCLAMARAGDGLILIEDGVLAAVEGGEWLQALRGSGLALYALQADLLARGVLQRLGDGITVVDDGGFVDLCCDYRNSHSWY